MGTIGDRFGDLAALFGAEGEAAPEDAVSPIPNLGEGGAGDVLVSATKAPTDAVGSADVVDPGELSGAETSVAPTLESVIATTITELNRADQTASDAALDWDLNFQALDLSGLPLWALVAEVERFLGRKFSDDQVETWESPRDMLQAAEGSVE